MNESRRALFLTAFVTLMLFTSIGYVSCKKESSSNTPDACSSVTCQNGGVCFKGTCTCPGGYEGTNCETRSLTRYLGQWAVDEVISGSTKPAIKGTSKTYNIRIVDKAGKAVSFYIQDLGGNTDWDNIECQIGRTGSGVETVTALPTYFVFSQYQVIPTSNYSILRGTGTINATGTNFNAEYYRTYGDGTGVNTDTVSLSATFLQK